MNARAHAYPVTVALIGTGAWGLVLAKAIAASSKIRIACCVGRDAERRARFVEQTGLPAAVDYEAVLADPAIDGVLLTLPNEMHLAFAAQAARAGKHVYLEKPVANTLDDGLRVAALESRYGVRVAVGHCARFLTGTRLLRALIDDGRFGQVNMIEAWFCNDRGLRLTPDDWRWYSDRAPGGCLSQIAIHQFDTLRYLGGELLSISATSAHRSPLPAEVEDQWFATVRFVDGKLGSVIASWTSPGAYGVRVTGERACATYEIDQARWGAPGELHRGARLEIQERSQASPSRQSITVPAGDMFRDELEQFAEGIVERQSIEISGDNGVQALAAVYAALASARHDGRAHAIAEIIRAAGGSVQDRNRTIEETAQ
ncbi:MAG: Gfo/Idh/MocA family oxidoreductase [Proteobacteria bacterium]|nr:Gfo/Idh/MocA family oxidoreductase [Burkholderiales bacterium]